MPVHSRWTFDRVVAAYEDHLRRVRGLREPTVLRYVAAATQFAREVAACDPLRVSRIRPSMVIEYISATARRVRPKTVATVATSLRSFFRFLGAAGLHEGRLDRCVPTAPVRRLAGLPRHLDEEQHARLLASLERSTPRLRRDRAMVLCLSALGLRAGELARLRLGDIDWRAGTIEIRSRKTRRGALLPLPRDVGDAIVEYLRDGRPATRDRHVFVRHGLGVGEPIAAHVVSHTVRKALEHARIAAPCFGAYLLRHTLATRMVRRGASLKEVADVLGHHGLGTTTIYAKTDVASLAAVALPWPEVTP